MRTLTIALGLLFISNTADAQYLRNAAGPQPVRREAVSTIPLTPTSPVLRYLNPDCDLDRTRGREAADQLHSGSGWMAGGFVSGVLLGLIGTGISYAIASSSSVEVSRVPDGVEASCYREGYVSKAKGTNTSNALTGGLLGTALLVVLIVSASSGSSY